MRKSKQDATETRKRIVQTAGEEFRRRGIGETSLADLMSAAGLTHGGFYRHFESKDQLVAEAYTVASESMLQRVTDALAENGGQNGLEIITSLYLSPEHRDHPGLGCALATLGSEVARSDDGIRAAATEGFLKLADIVAAQFKDVPTEVAKSRALATVATMVGVLLMSRVTPDPELSSAILRSATEWLNAPAGKSAG